MTMERWAPVPGFEGLYSVSDYGRVRSEARLVAGRYGNEQAKPERIVKLTQSDGYPVVHLWRENKRRVVKVATIVAAVFVGPRPPGLLVCHDDGDRGNNYHRNLRYDTQKGNMQDAIRHGTIATGDRHGHSAARRQARAAEV